MQTSRLRLSISAYFDGIEHTVRPKCYMPSEVPPGSLLPATVQHRRTLSATDGPVGGQTAFAGQVRVSIGMERHRGDRGTRGKRRKSSMATSGQVVRGSPAPAGQRRPRPGRRCHRRGLCGTCPASRGRLTGHLAVFLVMILSASALAAPDAVERATIPDVARKPAELALSKPVRFRVKTLRTEGGWAFLLPSMV